MQASAHQRAGRAGRTQPGKCFRLYTVSPALLRLHVAFTAGWPCCRQLLCSADCCLPTVASAVQPQSSTRSLPLSVPLVPAIEMNRLSAMPAGGLLQEGPAGADVPGDPALQPGLRGPAAKEAGYRRPGAPAVSALADSGRMCDVMLNKRPCLSEPAACLL